MNALGRFAEEYAAQRLQKDGYRVTARNFTCRSGELDIVAERDGIIVFAEVKARSSRGLCAPREAVTPAKMKKITSAALAFLQRYPSDLQPRFDVIELIVDKDGSRVLSYDHIVRAFDAVY